VLVIYPGGLPVRRQSPVQVVTITTRPGVKLVLTNVLTVTAPSHLQDADAKSARQHFPDCFVLSFNI